jgi:hypothetical protein
MAPALSPRERNAWNLSTVPTAAAESLVAFVEFTCAGRLAATAVAVAIAAAIVLGIII